MRSDFLLELRQPRFHDLSFLNFIQKVCDTRFQRLGFFSLRCDEVNVEHVRQPHQDQRNEHRLRAKWKICES